MNFEALQSSDDLELLERNFDELEGLESGFSAMEMSSSNFFQSRLQAKLSRKQISLNQNGADDAWDDGHQERMKAKSFVTVTDRRAKASELFEERLKKKMTESANSTVHKVPLVPHLPAIITVEKNSEHSVSVLGASLIGEMNDSDSSESESMKMSSNDRDRLANNMIESMKMPPSARDRLDEKVRARKAVEERLKKKMGQSAAVVREGPSTPPRPPVAVHIGPSKPSMRRRSKLSAKEVEERLKKKMIESSSVVPTSPVKSSPANDSFEQRLKKNKSESSLALPMDPSNPKPVLRPSNVIPDKSNAKGRFVQSQKLPAIESFEDSPPVAVQIGPSKPSMRRRPKLSAKEFEERLKKKMIESSSVVPTSPVKPPPANDSFEQRLKKNKSESSLAMPMDPSNPKPVMLPSNAIPDKSNAKGRFVQSRKLPGSESFEDRLKKKMSESADIERSSNNCDRLDGKIRARKAVEERLKRKTDNSSAKLLPSRDKTVIRHKSILKKKTRESVPSESNIMSRSPKYFEDSDNPTSPVESYLHTVKETFERRMMKKMSESSPPDESQKTKEVGSCEKLIERERKMNGFAAVPNNNAMEGSSKDRDRLDRKIQAREAVEERLKRKMSQCSSNLQSLESFEDCDNPTSLVESHLHTVKETFEQRMKKKMSESSPPVESQKMTEGGSCEELIERKMNVFDAAPNENAMERSSEKSDRLDRKIQAREAVEERLKRKMSQSPGNLLPSGDNTTSKFEGLLKRKMSQLVPSESNVISTRPDSCEGRDQPTSPDKSQQHTVKETCEQRMKKEMSFDNVPQTTNIMRSPLPLAHHLPAIITVEKNSEHSVSVLGASLMVEMSDSDSSECESMSTSSNDRDTLENKVIESVKMSPSARDRMGGKIQAGEAVEERLKRHMSQSSDKLLPSTDDTASRFQELFKGNMDEYSPSESNIMSIRLHDRNDSTSLAKCQKHTVKETFERRMMKKISETVIEPPMNTTPPVESQKMKEVGSYEERINSEMNGFATVPNNNATKSSSNDRDRLDSKIQAREAVEERLKRKMSQSPGNLLPSTGNAASLLKRKMSESVPNESSIIFTRPDSFEDRVIETMSEAVIVPPMNTTPPVQSQKMTEEGSYEENINSEMNGFATVPKNNATKSSSKDRDRLDSKIRAREAVEERLKRKMSQSPGNLLPSTGNAASLLKSKMSESVPNESSIIFTRLESFEDRVKGKMGGSDTVPLIDSDPPIESQEMPEKGSYEERIKREMNGFAAVPNKNAKGSAKDCDRLDGKIRAREAVEERLKRKMSQSPGNLLPSTDNAASLLKSKMGKSVPSESNIIFTRPDSFEDRANKKMSEAAIVPPTNATPPIEPQQMTEEGSYEERVNREIGGYAEVPFQENCLDQSVIDTPMPVPLTFDVKESQRRSFKKALKGKIRKSLTLSSKGGKISELHRLVLGDNNSTRHSAK